MAYNGKIYKATYFLPLSNQGLAYFLPLYLLPRCDQAHPMSLGQPSLFTEAKTSGSVSHINNRP